MTSASHPTYEKMAVAALSDESVDRKGLSRSAIYDYIIENYGVDKNDKNLGYLSRALKHGLENEIFAKVKGNGLSGSFKLAPDHKKKKPAVKRKSSDDQGDAKSKKATKKQAKETSSESESEETPKKTSKKAVVKKSPVKAKKAATKKVSDVKPKTAVKKVKSPAKKAAAKKSPAKKAATKPKKAAAARSKVMAKKGK